MEAAAKDFYDCIVVGGGPAGLTTGIYLARACCRVLVIERAKFGGQITITQEVVNYPGAEPMSGTALTERMKQQAARFGAEFLAGEVLSLAREEDAWRVETNRGTLTATAVLLATGAHPRTVGFDGEEAFRGRGVAYCATCDGEFFTGKEVFVIGGGFAAAEESVFLTRYAKHVTILMPTDDFTCAEGTAAPTKAHEKISIHYHAVVTGLEGDAMPRVLRWRDTRTGEEHTFRAEGGDFFGVFVFAGYEPSTQLAKGFAALDELGYILTDAGKKTSAEGLYAAGDVCEKPLRQVVTATGDGALAATEIEKYVHAVEERTGRRALRTPHAAPQHEVRDTGTAAEAAEPEDLFSGEMRAQLASVFARFTRSLQLELHLKDDATSAELARYMEKLAEMTPALSVTRQACAEAVPFVRVLREDGTPAGIAFHGVPGGHEFTSFVLGLYNAASDGQSVAPEDRRRIDALRTPLHLTILVSLSCTMCPELVTSAQRIATLSPFVTTDVYDIHLATDLRERYQVMSVPCFLIEEAGVARPPEFGRKSVSELLDLFEQRTPASA